MPKYKILLTGGGTGGHVYPALAIYQILKKNDLVEDVLYLGTRGKAEEKIVSRTDLKLRFVESSPFAGKSKLQKIKSLFKIALGTLQTMKELLSFKPDLVIGAGGYVSAPVVYGTFLLKPFLGTKIILDEQNLIPGLLNQSASLLADLVMLNYKASSYFLWSKRCVKVGFPVRQSYLSPPEKEDIRRELDIDPSTFVILVTGGSMGARSLNRAISGISDDLSKIDNLMVVHSFGMTEESYYDSLKDTVAILSDKLGKSFDDKSYIGVNDSGKVFYRGFRFIEEMYKWQVAADLVITRAGSGGLSEVSALGKASIIVPKRGMHADSQELNAIEIAESDAASVVFEKTDPNSGVDFIDQERFLKTILDLYQNNKRREVIEKNSADLFYREFEEKIKGSILDLMNSKEIAFLSNVAPPKFVKMQMLFDNLVRYLDNLYQTMSSDELEKNLYYNFYRTKLDEYLRSKSYLVKNKAIKLIGALRLKSYYPMLIENFSSSQGYLRRNTLISLKMANQSENSFQQLIEKALTDKYYEVRREAIELFIKFYENLDSENLRRELLAFRFKKGEHFEVIAASIRASVLIQSQNDFLETNEVFLRHRNVRIRQALMKAIEKGLEYGVLNQGEDIKIFLSKMLITTSEFSPHFKIKQSYNSVVERLESNGSSK